jgi:NADH-ubiquinone oxidoreductase chain 2
MRLAPQASTVLIGVSSMVKIGAAPVHFWFPEVARGLGWSTNIILITWQKIAPFVILIYLEFPTELLIIVCALSAIFGAFGGFGATSLRKILAYSSINHIAWIIIRTHYRQFIWITYFSIYCLITIIIINYFLENNFNTLRQLFTIVNTNYTNTFIVSLNILSIGGLPPFLGFYPKWLVIEFIVNENMYILVLLMIAITLIVLYFYLRLTYSCFIFYIRVNKSFTIINRKTNTPLAWLSVAGLLLIPIINFL